MSLLLETGYLPVQITYDLRPIIKFFMLQKSHKVRRFIMFYYEQ